VTPSRTHRRRFFAGLAAALAVGGGTADLLLRGAETERAEDVASREAIVSLLSLSELLARGGGSGDAVRALLRGWQAREPAGVEARVVLLSGIRLEASTAPSDTGDKAAPRRLARDEKALYDQAQRIRGAVESNREGAAPKPELEVERTGAGARVLAAPLLVGGEVVGVIRLVTQPPPAVPARSRLPSLAWLAGALAAFAAAASLLGERRWQLALAATAALVAGLGLQARGAVAALDASARRDHEAVAAAARAAGAGAAALIAELALPAGPPLDPAEWDADARRRPRGLLAPGGGVEPAAVDRDARALAGEASRSLIASGVLAILVLAAIGLGGLERLWSGLVTHRQAYAYVAPAVLGTLVLVFFPFLYGIALSFTDSNIYNTSSPLSDLWVGLRNYAAILGDFSMVKRAADGALAWNYLNFYWTFLFTVAWTVTNVSFGVSFGLLLALVLNTKGLALRPVYRVLLILPWAMPNYITALIWKGMFHRQFGVVNQVLQLLGLPPLSWFDQPFTSFLTALATNGWLSFPFMMVVSLGALQSIPSDIYEAARVDGASRWQQFVAITLPSLRPALVPAVILSVVWTFNMFNIIYLVTAGAPNGATEILITQAYKFAFERYRYGYAAAYSVVIFSILLVYGWFQNRVTKATEGI
jgi:arabinogalactan oligomer/maltooligosaccharide transport system permease protein